MKNFAFLLCFCNLLCSNPCLNLMKARTNEVNTFFENKCEHSCAALQPLDLSSFFYKSNRKYFNKVVLLYFLDDCGLKPYKKERGIVHSLNQIKQIADGFGYVLQDMQPKNEFFAFNSSDEFSEFMSSIFALDDQAYCKSGNLRFHVRFYYIRFKRKVDHG